MTRVTEPESGTQHSWDQNSGQQGPKPQRPTALRGSVRAERSPGRLPWDTGAGSSRPGDLALRPAVYTGQLRITRCLPPAQASGDGAAALTWGHHPPGWGAQWPLRVPSASPFFGFESSKDGTGIQEVTTPPPDLPFHPVSQEVTVHCLEPAVACHLQCYYPVHSAQQGTVPSRHFQGGRQGCQGSQQVPGGDCIPGLSGP